MDPKARLLEASRATIDGCFAKPVRPADDDSESPPIVACARHKALAIEAELEALAVNEEAALKQLEVTLDAVFAAGWPADTVAPLFAARAADVRTCATAKRAALQAEAVTADVALEFALNAVAEMVEVRVVSLLAPI